MITRPRTTLCLDGLTRNDIDLRESQVVDEEPFQFIEIESDGRGDVSRVRAGASQRRRSIGDGHDGGGVAVRALCYVTDADYALYFGTDRDPVHECRDCSAEIPTAFDRCEACEARHQQEADEPSTEPR